MSVSGCSSTSRTTGSGEPPGLKNAHAKRPSERWRPANEQELEPMDALERKIVHDAVAAIDGVQSGSRGEDPNRFVVISPARLTGT